MHPKLRNFFDARLERVLADLPESIHRLLEELPLHVEDYPDAQILEALGIDERDELCGLHTGIPLTEKWVLPDEIPDPSAVTIYREGILNLASDDDGNLNERELLKQIRITLLHELGHHHGLSEDDLTALGYD